MKRIGIYGGTFNPPHIGHILAAQQAIEKLQLDKLLLIPDRIAPHKQLPDGSASPQQRLQMLQLAADGIANLEVSDIELKREGISYTYLTVLELRKQYPDAQLFLIMGTDMFLSFLSWREPKIITDNATLAVLYRGDRNELEAIQNQKRVMEARGISAVVMENHVAVISSTQLRAMLVFGCADPYLGKSTGAFIRENGLYGTNVDYRGLSLDRLEHVVRNLCKSSRLPHILGCRDTAVELALRYGVDATLAARSALLHDITKLLSTEQQLTLCREYGIVPNDFSEEFSETFHALTGSYVADRVFGEEIAVVNAIRHHTTGAENMTKLDKILYIADQMEPTRNFPGVETLRELAREDLDRALVAGMEMTLAHLSRKGIRPDPKTELALARLKET